MRNQNFFILCGLAALVGCGLGKPRRLQPPRLDAESAGKAAVASYDANGDGRLDQNECDACPSLDDSFAMYDRDQDGQLTPPEIAQRLQAMLDQKLGLMPCYCYVYLDGRPLPGATVELVPEDFLGSVIPRARGTTTDSGRAMVNADAENLPKGVPGVRFGLYKVRITHPNQKIPARYDSATVLGFEVSPLERTGDSKEFRLSSR